MAILSKEAIRKVRDCKVVEVEMPEWDGSVCLKSMSGKERVEMVNLLNGKKKEDVTPEDGFKSQFSILSVCIVNEDGTRMFDTGDEAGEAFGDKSFASIDHLFAEALKVSGLNPEAVTEAAENLD